MQRAEFTALRVSGLIWYEISLDLKGSIEREKEKKKGVHPEEDEFITGLNRSYREANYLSTAQWLTQTQLESSRLGVRSASSRIIAGTRIWFSW